MSRIVASILALGVLAGVAGCAPGWIGAAGRQTVGFSCSADYLPKPAVIGQPITVMGFYLDSSLQGSASVPLSTTSVRIQLGPIKGQSEFRIDLGTAPLIDGRFNWTDTLRPTYGGVTLKASESYLLFADFGYQIDPDGKRSSRIEYSMTFTPVATP